MTKQTQTVGKTNKEESQFELTAKIVYDLIKNELDRDESVSTIVLHLKNSYNEGLRNGWKLSNNNIKEVLKPWSRGIHNIKIELLK